MMSKICKTIVLILCISFSIKAQNETWNFQSYAIGSLASGGAYTPNAGMPDVIQIGSTYYMYFGFGTPGNNVIKYATSPDLINWTVQGTVLSGSSNPVNREYHMGGPRVVKLNNGQYRMFYRACENYTTAPPYHCLSAISNDGINFTKESGVRIEIKPYLPNSYFKRAAHSAFYKDAGGTMRAILTGNDTTMFTGPDRLYTASSPDEGLTWFNFVPLYSNGHDPVVIKDGSGTYHLYYTYLNTGFRKATSANGAVWPTGTDTVYFKQGTSILTEGGSPNSIADLGGWTNSAGNVVLYSAYKTALGPWTNVAFYTKEITTVIDELNKLDDTSIISPNPFSSSTVLKIERSLNNALLRITNSIGQLVGEIENINGQEITIQRNNLPQGIYFVSITEDNKQFPIIKLVIND